MPIVSIVIPALNEASPLTEVLPAVLECCRRRNWNVIVVNDGSVDGTREVLEAFRASPQLTIVHHKVNRGYGSALKSGIALAQGDLVVTMDADGQHDIDSVDLLVNVLQQTDADLVIGARTGRDGQPVGTRYRMLGRWLIRKFAGLLVPLQLQDLNSGFKLYRRLPVQAYLPLCPDSMAFSDVMTLVFVSQRHLVAECPIETSARRAGTSTVRTLTAFETLIEILNIIMLLDPLRIFVSIALVCFAAGLAWGIPLAYLGRGVSVGSMLAITSGLLFFFLGLLAHQLAAIRRDLRGLPKSRPQ